MNTVQHYYDEVYSTTKIRQGANQRQSIVITKIYKQQQKRDKNDDDDDKQKVQV